jgi:Xaa-Pro dipeptidase
VTRTVFFGRPGDEAHRAWDAVKRAQETAFDAMRPGVPAGSIDAAARRVIEDAGYGPGYRFFTHRLGHGIGMEGHEDPYFVEGNPLRLEPGMTLSDEPGIYVPGSFGIRLEDIVAITDSGAEYLGRTQDSPDAAAL